MGLAMPQSAGQSFQSTPAFAALAAARAAPRAWRSAVLLPDLGASACAAGAETAPAISAAAANAPAEPITAFRLPRAVCLVRLKWGLPHIDSIRTSIVLLIGTRILTRTGSPATGTVGVLYQSD